MSNKKPKKEISDVMPKHPYERINEEEELRYWKNTKEANEELRKKRALRNLTQMSQDMGLYDAVNSPAHYQNSLGVEVIDIIEEYYKDNYHLGNAVKYLLRAKYKGKMEEDLRKCIWYIKRALEDE